MARHPSNMHAEARRLLSLLPADATVTADNVDVTKVGQNDCWSQWGTYHRQVLAFAAATMYSTVP